MAGVAGTTRWPQLRQITSPARAKSRASASWISVIVPTVLRLECRPCARPTAIAGGIPSIESASGLSSFSRNWRVYGENVSTYRRWPSA